ncbi:MAG: chordopoxvirus fusion protein [Nitrospinae bacterium]|nr:chordopoxvirus fusion protein [Nitrospinota bacterium]
MLTTHTIKTELEKVFKPKQASVLAKVIVDTHSELVKTDDFNELKDIVKELGIKVGELAEAQKRTEVRVEELAEAQKELAEAQKRTEVEIKKLTKAQLETDKTLKRVQKELGGLSHTVGYHLEDRAYKTLPALLKRDLRIEVEGRLIRKYFIYAKGREDEVNIYGRGFRDGREVVIIGESKSQLSKDDIDDFLDIAERVAGYTKIGDKEKILIAVSYSIRPEVEEYAGKKGVKVYWSYELDL